MDAKSIIENKRDKKELTKDEIRHFIAKYNKDSISDVQAASLITLIYTNGLTEEEMVNFISCMAETGELINLGNLSKDIIDIHSIGGMNEKVPIILACALSSLGIPVAKISGRELGLIDKLQSIPDYNALLDIEKFKQNILKEGIGIISEPSTIAPVENKIYNIRSQIACMDSIVLTAIGIMSTKIAIGANNIIFDIAFGKSTYLKTKEEAKNLAKLLILMGKYFDKLVKCVITEQNEPLGYTFGNIAEIDEVIKCLNGDMAEDIRELVLELGDKYLSLTGKGINSAKNKAMILEEIESRRAYKKFLELVKIQEGNTEKLSNIAEIKKTKIVIPVLAEDTGYVKNIDIDIVRSIGVYLEAIRDKVDSNLDIGAGIEFNKKIGDKVEVGEVLAYVRTNNEEKVKGTIENLNNAFEISKNPVEKTERIVDVIE